MGEFVKGAGIFAHNVGRKNRKCEEFLICAYGFLAILCDFLIFAYQILGWDCEFFVNRGPGAAARGRFVGTSSRRFCGALQAFSGKGISVYVPALQGCTAALYGADRVKEKPRFSAGRGLSVICCGWAFGIVLCPLGSGLRAFQRCGRAFSSGLVRLRRRLTARPTRRFWRLCGGRGCLFQ